MAKLKASKTVESKTWAQNARSQKLRREGTIEEKSELVAVEMNSEG